MSKVIYEEFYGIWGETDENGNMIEKNMGVKGMPICPKCKEPTYNEDICPFCKEPLEYE